jgi:hypothetical protein
VRVGALTDTFQVRLAKFLREFLRQTERNGESIRRSDRQNANIAWAEFDLKARRWVRDAHCRIVMRALDRVGRHPG